ncbi:hypothetical protein [Actinoplanes sp. DH11]|uniref:hypothetical protein n=1 Tax=Actinoplanes sp. DH11 TaxID=2857011 RepID=UPI001E4DA0AB|nr:hypothetical protein [Actinoplanes sp. DH11]
MSAHLAVDIAAWWTSAVYETGGGVHPVIFDGQPRLPSGVRLDPPSVGVAALAAGMTDPDGYLPDPMAALHAGGGQDAVAAVSAVLCHVAVVAAAQSGTAITALTVVTAQGWGHRARQRLQQAATLAGLPEPNLVTAAAAAAAGVDGPGRFVVVGTARPHLAVLDVANGYQQLAAAVVLNPDAPAVDDALTPAAVAGGDWRLAREVDQARANLAVHPRASLLLPEPHPPAVLSRDDVTAAAAPHLDGLKEHVEQLLADADLDAGDISTVVLVGDDPVVGALEAGLGGAGLPAATTLRDPHAIPRGALRITQPLVGGAAQQTAATVRLPRTRLTLANLMRIAVLAACSVALLFQTIATADTWTRGIDITDVALPVENLGVAAALAALTAWAAAQLVPTTWILSSHADDPATTGALLRRGYLGAAVLGLVLAGLWGMGTGVGVGFTNDSYLNTALTWAAPISASAAVIAVIAPRIPAACLPDWLRRTSPPVLTIALGAAGIYLQQAANSLSFPVDLIGMVGFTQTVGAALLGVATALLATRQPLLRIITALILGAGYALVADVRTDQYLTTAWLIVMAWWAITTTATTVRTALPAGWPRGWITPTA